MYWWTWCEVPMVVDYMQKIKKLTTLNVCMKCNLISVKKNNFYAFFKQGFRSWNIINIGNS